MNRSIFDLIEDEQKTGQEGYFQLAENAPEPKDDSFLSQVQEYGKSILKGGIEGISRFGRMMGPLRTPGQSEEELMEAQTAELDRLFPTEDEGFGQRALRRGLKEAPTMLGFPGGGTASTAIRSLAAGFLGERAKDLGAPEWAQSALELSAFVGPDIMKKLVASGKNKEIITWARKMGMTDEQIAPLLNSQFKEKWATKLSPKRGQTEKALGGTKEGLSNAYGAIQKSEMAAAELGAEQSQKLISDIEKMLFEMPADVRSKIGQDFADLQKFPITGDTLINFWQDLNSVMGPGSKKLSLLKGPLSESISSISPELSKDFEMINKLWSKYHSISGKLKPTLTSDLVKAAETIGILGSLGTFNYPALGVFLGEVAAKKIAQQMLINPRFQQLSQKMSVAVKQNKFGLAQKLVKDFADEIRKYSPDGAEKLEKMTDDELREFLSHQKSIDTRASR